MPEPCPTAAVGDELRRMFDSLASDPMPDRLVSLCDALEDAFQRGQLFPGGCKRDG